MKLRSVIPLALCVGALALMTFIGVQMRWDIDQDHVPIKDPDLFIKARPSLSWIYVDPTDCGACEEHSVNELNTDNLQKLQAFCAARRDIPKSCAELAARQLPGISQQPQKAH